MSGPERRIVLETRVLGVPLRRRTIKETEKFIMRDRMEIRASGVSISEMSVYFITADGKNDLIYDSRNPDVFLHRTELKSVIPGTKRQLVRKTKS